MIYVDECRMKITCGEAPYLVNHYNATTVKIIHLSNVLDFQIISLEQLKRIVIMKQIGSHGLNVNFLNLFMFFNIKQIVFFWQQKTFLQPRAGVVQKNCVKSFILILIFTTTTELRCGLKDNYEASYYDCTKCLKNHPMPLLVCNLFIIFSFNAISLVFLILFSKITKLVLYIF